MLQPYYVISEEYQTFPGSYEPPEAPEYGCDVIEVEASTKREAVILGVRLALQKRRSLADINRSDGQSPFVGYHAELARCGHGHPHFLLVNGKPVYLRCWVCAAPVEGPVDLS